MNVAIIPARGGSKRIPRKNTREFCGRPMIAWSIEAAQKSGAFDRIIVSTDHPEVRETALSCGAEVPFLRPADLADDHTTTIPVIRHAVEWLLEKQVAIQFACCIYATAPFLQSRFLCAGLDLLKQNAEADFVISVASFGFPVSRALKLDADNKVSMFWPEHELTRSQDLPLAYHDAGQFYWGTTEAWRARSRLFSSQTRAVVLPQHLVQDIDTPDDWQRAERMFRSLQNE